MVYYKVARWQQGYHEVFEVQDNYYLNNFDDNDYLFANIEDARRVLEYLVADYSTHFLPPYTDEEIKVTRDKDSAFAYGCVELWIGDDCVAYREFWVEEVTVKDGLGRWEKILNG